MLSRKSIREIKLMQEAGQIVAKTLRFLQGMLAPGITTAYLDEQAEKFILAQGATPAFKGYRGFPASICASINEEIVHGLPSTKTLREGDIFKIDIGVRWQGYIGDAAHTYPIGKISKAAQNLLKTCEECLHLGIQAAQPDKKVSDISRAVQQHAEKNGYSVVREYTGHGVGTSIHEDPQVPNFVDKNWQSFDLLLKPGYCLAIEPMVNIGTYHTKTIRRQGWDVVVTRDRKLSAHFEHSIAILENGPIILTQETPVPLS